MSVNVTFMTNFTITPDNRRVISCTPGHKYCSLLDISDPLNVINHKIPLPPKMPMLKFFSFSHDMKILYILFSSGVKSGDYKLMLFDYEEILNSPGNASYQIGETIRIKKPETFVSTNRYYNQIRR